MGFSPEGLSGVCTENGIGPIVAVSIAKVLPTVALLLLEGIEWSLKVVILDIPCRGNSAGQGLSDR